ncbi:MAG: hypothetical protein MUF63_11200 [Rhodobacteraceae bacterium]|jgi:uncharacterized protein YdeI (BOF family)|nr:hypothetical protein [Paracoccaceae bacterium]
MKPALLAAAFVLASPAAADQPTPIAEISRNAPATVAGTVDRLTDEDEFVLADQTGQVRVYVGPNRVPVAPGDVVTVSGMVDEALRLEIYADTIVRADGTTFTFTHE